MILLLGASSYIGQAFARELRARGEGFIPLARGAIDYTRFEVLFEYVRTMKPDFLINAGGLWNNPAADSEHGRTEMFQANTLLPQTIGRVCSMTNTPWGHVSSACIYSGAKVFWESRERTDDGGQTTEGGGQGTEDSGQTPVVSPGTGEWRLERDLETPRLRRFFTEHPENFLGFNELDEPNCCFRSPPCSYLAGTKALAEEWLRGQDGVFIWRAGIPFDESEAADNLLQKLQKWAKVLDRVTTLSHLHDFVNGCLGLIERNASFGTYNVTNRDAITTREMVELIQSHLRPEQRFEFWKNHTEYYLNSATEMRPSCIIDSTKMARVGLAMPPVRLAVENALAKWNRSDKVTVPTRSTPMLKIVTQ